MAQVQLEQGPSSLRPNADAGPQKRIRELDGWRAISVLLVLLHHIFSIQYPDLLKPYYLAWHTMGFAGFLGVDTFFVISGFVICRLLLVEESRYGAVSLKGFYIRRVFRILPPLYLYLGTLAVLFLTGFIQERWLSLGIAAAFLYDINILPASWYLGHTWSLAVEEQFYLLFPTLFILCKRRWRGYLFAATFLLAAGWSISLAISHSNDPAIDARTRAGFACISFGVLAAIHEARFRQWASRVPAWVVALTALVLLLHPVQGDGWLGALFSALFQPPAIATILLYSLDCGGRLKAFLCSRPVQAVGLTSYGIYLWQQMFTGPLAVYAVSGIHFPPVLLLPLLFLIVPASYYLLEKPAMNFGKKLSKGARDRTLRNAA